MSQKESQSPRSKRNRLERIDIDELFDSPSNRGMLSFLERAPEEARARLEERRKVDSAEAARTSLPRSANALVLNRSSSGEVATGVDSSEQNHGPLRSRFAENEELGPERRPSGGELPPVPIYESGELPPVHSLPTRGDLPPVGAPYTDPDSPSGGLPSSIKEETLTVPLADRVSASPAGGDLHPEHERASVRELPPGANLPRAADVIHKRSEQTFDYNSSAGTSSRDPYNSPEINSQDAIPGSSDLSTVGNLTPVDALLPAYYASHFNRELSDHRTSTPDDFPKSAASVVSGGKLPTDIVDGAIIGRRQKIRRAFVAQDGHSSGEQLLYQTLWNAARPEPGSVDRRVIVAGYQGMSALCKLDKKNCKKNAKGLIDKLAIEVAETYRSDERIGTTYRIFSYKEILKRREEAGMVWVVRTSGVRFVALAGEDRQAGQGVTHPVPNSFQPLQGSRAGAGGNSPIHPPGDSPTDPVGDWSRASVGNLPTATVGETPIPLRKERKLLQETSSVFPKHLGSKLRSILPSFDDDATRQLWARCYQIAPDCTDDDIEYCFRIKANQLLRGRKKIENPVGIMIWSVPKTFEGTDPLYLRRRLEIERIRNAEEEERQRSRATLIEMLEDSRTSPEDKTIIQGLLAQVES